MKIRILGNSVRLRLSQTEVEQILEKGRVTQKVKFGTKASQELHYTLEKTDISSIQAAFNTNEICVQIPLIMANNCASSNEVSLESHMPIEAEEQLRILVEKDFKCIDARKGEDESDLFPNPSETHGNENLK